MTLKTVRSIVKEFSEKSSLVNLFFTEIDKMPEKISKVIEIIGVFENKKFEKDVAELLGMTKENLYSYKKRDVISYEQLFLYCEQRGLRAH